MLGNSLNLVDMVWGYLSGDVIGRMSSAIGESTDRTHEGLTAAVPGLLAGLSRTASTSEGARRITSAISDADDSVLDNPLGKQNRGLLSDTGSGILQSIMGGGELSQIGSSIARSSGLSGRAVTSLLGMLTPIVFGVLQRVMRTIGPDRFDITSLLASQKSNIAAAMPRETFVDPRTTSRERVTETYTETRAPQRAAHMPGWVLPLLLLAGAIGLFSYWMGRPHRMNTFVPPSTVHAGGEDTTARTGLSFDQLKTKYASVLREARTQGVQISDLRQENGKLVIQGTAPSLEAANKVWDEIKRVNLTMDDITANFQVASTSSSQTQLPAVDQSSRDAYSYRQTESTTPNESAAAPAEPATPTESTATEPQGFVSQTYTVQAGDTLTSISKLFYGNTKDYTRILNANRDKIDNENLVEVGQELSIP